MTLIKQTLVLTFCSLLVYSIKAKTSANEFMSFESFENKERKEDFKHGQYVYVTLKDGSRTVGKIVGKRNTKKYYVNQLNGSHHGVVHKKYIRKMTKEEVQNYLSKDNKSG